MKIIRYLLFLPICFLAIGVVYWVFGQLINWFLGLDLFWLIVVLFLLGATIWGLFMGFSSLLMNLASKISPNKSFSFWTVLILSLLNGIWTIINVWSLDVIYNGKIVFDAIIVTLLILELTFALIFGSATAIEQS